MKDPDGANLDRIQIIKVWVDAQGKTHEQIMDVAWSGNRQPGSDKKIPTVDNTVDLQTAKYTNSIGASHSWATELIRILTLNSTHFIMPGYLKFRPHAGVLMTRCATICLCLRMSSPLSRSEP